MGFIPLPPGMDPEMIPAAMPPPGVMPNFKDPESLKGTMIGVTVTLMVVSVFLAVCALPSRLKKPKFADICIVISLVIAIGYSVVIISRKWNAVYSKSGHFLADDKKKVSSWAYHMYDLPISHITKRWTIVSSVIVSDEPPED